MIRLLFNLSLLFARVSLAVMVICDHNATSILMFCEVP